MKKTPFIGEVKLFTDGASRGNPGASAIGFLILDKNNNQLSLNAECIGESTNNRAEYRALIKGLEMCAEFTRGRVTAYSDSELVIRQLNRGYRIRNKQLQELFFKVRERIQLFDEVVFNHVSRNNPFLRRVDKVVNDNLEGR